MPRDLSRPIDPTVQHVLDLMGGFARVRARSMFGGHGLYRDDLMFGLMVDGDLYLKVDEQALPHFTDRNLRPFTYEAKGRRVSLSYHEAPPEALEDEAAMANWCELAWAAALRTKAAGAKGKDKGKGGRPRVPAKTLALARSKPGGVQSLSQLVAVPNLGPRSVEVLAAAGITSLEQLQALGAVRAFVRARSCSDGVSLNLLWALEGALTGRPWQDVAQRDRASLLMALEDVVRAEADASRRLKP